MLNPVIYSIVLAFISLFIILAAIIIGFDCIWRVERRLAIFMKLFVAALVPMALRQIAIIVGYTQYAYWSNVDQYLEILTGLLLVGSMIEMFRIIRSLDKEDR